VLNFGSELDVETFQVSKKGVGVEEESVVFPISKGDPCIRSESVY